MTCYRLRCCGNRLEPPEIVDFSGYRQVQQVTEPHELLPQDGIRWAPVGPVRVDPVARALPQFLAAPQPVDIGDFDEREPQGFPVVSRRRAAAVALRAARTRRSLRSLRDGRFRLAAIYQAQHFARPRSRVCERVIELITAH